MKAANEADFLENRVFKHVLLFLRQTNCQLEIVYTSTSECVKRKRRIPYFFICLYTNEMMRILHMDWSNKESCCKCQ